MSNTTRPIEFEVRTQDGELVGWERHNEGKWQFKKVDGIGNYWFDGIIDTRTNGISDYLHRRQFTGLTDKNGVKIFEGDILTTGHLGFSESVTFENGCFQLKTNKEQGVSILVQDRAARLTISGNIYTL